MLENRRLHFILSTYLRDWSTGPDAVDLFDVKLDLSQNEKVNELCEQIARQSSQSPLRRQPKSVVALLLMKIARAMEISESLPPRTIVINGPALRDEQEETEMVFTLILPTIELEETMEGRSVDAVWLGRERVSH